MRLVLKIQRLKLYYHTIKYLKFSQIFYRIYRRFKSPKTNNVIGSIASKTGDWLSHPLYEQKLFDGYKVNFLNLDGKINTPDRWDTAKDPILWRYNLHYFDDLSAINSDQRLTLQINFINRWIDENTQCSGVGWQPYPTSLRIVNWIKYFLAHPELLTAKISNSLAQQVDFLSQDLEKHLGGNHLLENAKSLIFAGLFFEGAEAEKWLSIGCEIFKREITEQTLADGGNFELTPMYHAIILSGFLDTINISNVYPHQLDAEIVTKLNSIIAKMLSWLVAMSHPDQKISFFNDATFDIAPENSIIFEYAKKLGFEFEQSTKNGMNITDLAPSGYIVAETNDYKLIADVGAIGPDYLPGHGHADVLSFEFSLAGQRVFVNSGISQYGLGDQRLIERKTAAHNCLTIDNLDTSHVWSGFRVAKRSTILDKKIQKITDDKYLFGASHDGFKVQQGKAIHYREWACEPNSISISDSLFGEFEQAVASFHLHPNVKIIRSNDNSVSLAVGGVDIEFSISDAVLEIKDCFWYDGFNRKQANKKILVSFLTNKNISKVKWNNNSGR